MASGRVTLKYRGPYAPEKGNHGFVRIYIPLREFSQVDLELEKRKALRKLQRLYAQLEPPVRLKSRDIELISTETVEHLV